MIYEIITTAVVGFIFGIFPSAILVSKFAGIDDPRTYGSKNPGATNVLRSGNKFAAAIVLIIDFLKGLTPVIICAYHVSEVEVSTIAAFFAVVGHVFNPILKFKGGKGVATSLGAILAINWQVFLIAVAVWIIMFSMTKTSSLSSVMSLVVAMLFAAWIYEFGTLPPTAIAGMAMLVVIRHRQNFKQLLMGNENKFK